jgi:CBS domain containing-hemolysin-like protein
MRPPLFVPESRSIGDLFNDLRRAKVHLAIVLDEFGGTAGLVTVEDILEEIVGEIADEHEQAPLALIRPVAEGTKEGRAWDIDGRAHVNDVNAQLHLGTNPENDPLPERDDYDTIAGFIIATLGRIPKVGEKLTLVRGMTITIAQAEPRRIVRVRVDVAGATSSQQP